MILTILLVASVECCVGGECLITSTEDDCAALHGESMPADQMLPQRTAQGSPHQDEKQLFREQRGKRPRTFLQVLSCTSPLEVPVSIMRAGVGWASCIIVELRPDCSVKSPPQTMLWPIVDLDFAQVAVPEPSARYVALVDRRSLKPESVLYKADLQDEGVCPLATADGVP